MLRIMEELASMSSEFIQKEKLPEQITKQFQFLLWNKSLKKTTKSG